MGYDKIMGAHDKMVLRADFERTPARKGDHKALLKKDDIWLFYIFLCSSKKETTRLS